MLIIFAGKWSGPNQKAFNGRHVAVMVGDAQAHHGVTLGVPVRVEADPASPLRFSIAGEWDADTAKSLRQRGKGGGVCVVVEGTDEEIVALVRVDDPQLFARNVRVVNV